MFRPQADVAKNEPSTRLFEPATPSLAAISELFWKTPFRRVAQLLVACVLIGAGLLKLSEHFYGSSNSGLISNLMGTNAGFVIGIFEFLLGAALILMPASVWLWILALLAFGIFAMINSAFVAVGQTECECFGAIRSRPVISLVIDLLAIAGVWYASPLIKGHSLIQSVRAQTDGRAFLAAIIAFGLVLYLEFSISGRTLLAQVQGAPLINQSSWNYFGERKGGELLESTVRIQNISANPVTINGFAANCRNSIVSQLPLLVRPNSIVEIKMRARVGRLPGFGSGQLTLFTDDVNSHAYSIPYVYLSKGR